MISNYENVDIELNIADGKLVVSIYDNEILEKQEELEMEVTTSDFAVKMRKRIPLCSF